MSRQELRICPICDARYFADDAEEAKIHEHPEPQSGDYRQQFLLSRLPYSEWLTYTWPGRAWALQTQVYLQNATLAAERKRCREEEVEPLLDNAKDDLDAAIAAWDNVGNHPASHHARNVKYLRELIATIEKIQEELK